MELQNKSNDELIAYHKHVLRDYLLFLRSESSADFKVKQVTRTKAALAAIWAEIEKRDLEAVA